LNNISTNASNHFEPYVRILKYVIFELSFLSPHHRHSSLHMQSRHWNSANFAMSLLVIHSLLLLLLLLIFPARQQNINNSLLYRSLSTPSSSLLVSTTKLS